MDPVLTQRTAAVVRLAAGDAATLAEAYQEHQGVVRALARRLLGDDASVEDLVHDVFADLPAAARRFRGEASLRALLLAIAGNRARRQIRTAIRRRRALATLRHEPRASLRDPEAAASDEELRGLAAAALAALAPKQRIVFVLCELQERPVQEVAQTLGIPRATVRTRLFHARRRLGEASGTELGPGRYCAAPIMNDASSTNGPW